MDLCGRGHELDTTNTYWDPRGKRQCRACRKLAAQRFRDNPASTYRKQHAVKKRWPETFWALVDRRGPDECWRWLGGLKKDGYSAGHRTAYELLVGPIPEGLEIDHLCRVRACCNPKHMEPVTHAVNVQRGDHTATQDNLGAYQRVKTHCPQGHPYSGPNLKIGWKGARVCRICELEKSRRWQARNRS